MARQGLLLAIIFAALFVDAAKISSDGYALTPMGRYPRECVHTIDSHSSIEDHPDGAIITDRNGNKRQITPCRQKRVEQVKQKRSYDGWLAYTTYLAPIDIDSFLGYFSVPNQPANDPEVLYLFTGLQNVDWIPIVDPQPAQFDIIQPVLQYPGDGGDYWSVKSWYVTLTDDVLESNEFATTVGNNIFGNMTKTGANTWFIGANDQSGGSTSLTVTRSRLSTQPWAYTTAECYGCDGGCSYEPTNGCDFTNMKLFYQGKPVIPKWTASTSPNPMCNEKATIISPSAVTITFQ
eukprot:TRINITY_DN670_c0_g1_i2.p1 TRINITY_DN670_c0_g1~~TRINITY_DN670_c0_g1_i2.p1  ORF type:complete len:292 (+),score=45.28 TRINITY_DN670_c0_g1_i2:3-878(+)